MRSLYLKIFVWFWIAMGLVTLAMVVAAVSTQTGEQASRWRPLVGRGLELNGRQAARSWEERGLEGLREVLEPLQDDSGLGAYFYDREVTELSGREAPEGAAELARRVLSTSRSPRGFDTTEGMRLAARRVRGPGGDPYVIVGALPDLAGDRRRGDRPPAGLFRVFLDNPGSLATWLGVGLLTAGLVCYGLARYLTSPLDRLRDATNRLAAGDLAVRVAPTMVGRHDEIAELGRDFDTMAERIESLVTHQRRLLSDISHELRSPLARLNVALELARQKAAGADDALDRIERESGRLNELIGHLLVLSRLETGLADAEWAPLDLQRLVSSVVEDADFEAVSHDRRVRIVSSAAARVRGSEHLLRSAVENVVRNAVRHTAPGTTVEVSMEPLAAAAAPGGTRDAGEAAPAQERGPSGAPSQEPAVSGETSASAGRVVVRVRDHGPGVPPAALDELFEPFYRVEDARDRNRGGTGLGLAITRRAVRLHGGTATARNGADGGLVVELELPVE